MMGLPETGVSFYYVPSRKLTKALGAMPSFITHDYNQMTIWLYYYDYNQKRNVIFF